MRNLSWVTVQSDKDTHFTGAIAQNAGENEDIAVPVYVKSAAVVAVQILSVQNLDWEVWFSSKTAATAFGSTDQDADGYLGRVAFAVADGKQHGDTATHYYYNQELATPIPLYDDVRTNDALNLHLRLVNRNATAKQSGSSGAISIRVCIDAGVR